MRLRFDGRSALFALFWFAVLVWLATAGANLGWLRGFGGDVLAVIWLYCLLRAALDAPAHWLAGAALGCGLLIESGQYLAATFHWQIGNRALRIVLGATPDWLDVLAYCIGFVLILAARHARVALRPAGN
ncbi:ribosomal maturation YjgA family protein [Pseudomonas nicosulfuronedens]